jgi:hypothetical protein
MTLPVGTDNMREAGQGRQSWLSTVQRLRWLSSANWAIVFCLTWLAITYLPHFALRPSIDGWCQGALSYFAKSGAQFGRQVIFAADLALVQIWPNPCKLGL